MLPEVEDLERRGLFTREETRAVIQRRRELEYRLRRRAALLEDFQNYIHYEKQLEALRQLRKRGLVRKLKKKKGQVWKPSLSDHAGVKRVFFLYNRATRKFPGNLELWIEYLDFCRASGAYRHLQKVIHSICSFICGGFGMAHKRCFIALCVACMVAV